MRMSKTNHSILSKKRYREDESAIEGDQMIAGDLEQNIQKNEQQANIERSGNKRRFIES
jgi:hypothetical protein